MSGAPSPSTAPAFARGVRLKFDEARNAWIVLAPERMFVPDEIALEVLKLVDGMRTLGQIADELGARFVAPRQEVLSDITELLSDLAAKGALTL